MKNIVLKQRAERDDLASRPYYFRKHTEGYYNLQVCVIATKLLDELIIFLVAGETDENACHNEQNADKCQQKVVVRAERGRKKAGKQIPIAFQMFHPEKLADVVETEVALTLEDEMEDDQHNGYTEYPPTCFFEPTF